MTRDSAENQRWHLKKEIQLGHIITTVTVAVSVVIYTQRLEQRIALMEQSAQTQTERDGRQDKVLSESLSLMRDQLNKIDVKLDRLVERKP